MKKFFLQIRYIAEGYWNWFYDWISGKASARVKERMHICKDCVYNNKYGICSLCGCIIKAKIRVDFPKDENNKSIGGCPIKKW